MTVHTRVGLQGVLQMPMWDLAFRPWFLLGTVTSLVSLTFWVLMLSGQITWLAALRLTPIVWHIHEMLFGFAATIAMGFLLTAAQTWTGMRSVHGLRLLALTLLWLAVRVLLYSQSTLGVIIALCLQVLWWLGCIVSLAILVCKTQNRRNYQFIPLLSLMMLLNVAIVLADLMQHTDLALHLSRAVVLLFTLLVSIVGGRVIPFFTSRGAMGAKVRATVRLDQFIVGSTLITLALFVLTFFIALPLSPAVFMVLTGGLHLWRLAHWDSLATRGIPLLWSLHATYLAMALGFMLLGTSYWCDAVRFADGLHLITLGTIGGMILAMMARVALGHTGRPLQPHAAMSVAFGLILIAAIIRVVLPFFNQALLSWQLSTALWILAFALFVVIYTPILCRARQN